MRVLTAILAGALLISLPSCNEDEFIEPVTVNLQITMTHTQAFEQPGGSPMKDKLEFNEGNFSLASVEFDGERQNNDNHYFSREFTDIVVADLMGGELNQPVTFDIPQGSYNHIRLTLHTAGGDTASALTFKGKWKHPSGNNATADSDGPGEEEIPIELNFFSQSEAIPLTLHKEDNGQQIVFKGDNWNTLEITINMAHLFRYFNPGRLRQAEVHGTGNQRKIIVSAKHNQELYYSLVERVERSMKAVVK